MPKSTLHAGPTSGRSGSDWLDGKRVPSAVRLDQLLQRVGGTAPAQREFAVCSTGSGTGAGRRVRA